MGGLLNIATDKMLSAFTAFYIWKWFSEAINVNNQGEDIAEKNVSILNKYRNFFQQIIISSYESFVTDLAVFFDAGKYETSFSLTKVLSVFSIQLSEEQFAKLRDDVLAIKNRHGVQIAFILELRNKEVSHKEIVPTKRVLVFSEIEELFKAVQEILDRISLEYDRSTTTWKHVEDGVKQDLNLIIDNLNRGEKLRIDEMNSKWLVESNAPQN